MRIYVTKSDIARGERDDCKICPIALSLRRRFQYHSITVNTGDAWIGGKTVPLPTVAQRFINRFDKGRLVKPFNFKLELP